MRYRLHKLGETKVSSAYCPICCKKTIEITGRLEPQFIHGKIKSYQDGLVSPSNLCCSTRCLDIYQGRIHTELAKDWSAKTTTAMMAYGMLPTTLKETQS